MADEPTDGNDPASHFSGNDAEDRILAALTYLRRSAQADGETHWQTDSSCQKAYLQKWAEDLGLVLDFSKFADRLARGGQEHDVFIEGDRYFKLTRQGVFGCILS